MKYQSTFSNSLHKITQYNFKENISFVFFKKPKEAALYYIEFDEVSVFSLKDLDSKKCFLFAPFDSVHEPLKRLTYQEKLINDDILNHALRLPIVEASECNINALSNRVSSHEDFIELVNLIQSRIEQGVCEKIIASRIYTESMLGSPHDGFLQLCDKYNHSFNYLIYISGECYWIGASPEVLLSCVESEFSTMSLAGTQLVKAGKLEYEWKDKEKIEQQMVTDYITSVLSFFKLTKIMVSLPYTFTAANLVHLKTDIKAMVADEQLLIEVLKRLNPTPAVCGLPKEQALVFIDSEEKHQRKYYAGFLGEWNGIANTQLYVNLRCAELSRNSISYFVGSGITAGSQAEKEWEETERKIDTLRNVLVGGILD